MPSRIALITSATDGIGKATAKKLLREGWRVVVIGRNPQKCDATVAELQKIALRGTISAIPADLTLMRETTRAVETFLKKINRSISYG